MLVNKEFVMINYESIITMIRFRNENDAIANTWLRGYLLKNKTAKVIHRQSYGTYKKIVIDCQVLYDDMSLYIPSLDMEWIDMSDPNSSKYRHHSYTIKLEEYSDIGDTFVNNSEGNY